MSSCLIVSLARITGMLEMRRRNYRTISLTRYECCDIGSTTIHVCDWKAVILEALLGPAY